MKKFLPCMALSLLPSLLIAFSPAHPLLAADGLVEMRLLSGAAFTREAGAPDEETRTFLVKRPVAQSYLLRVDPTEATSAEITLNGVAVYGPSDFPVKKGTRLEREVSVGASNDVTVKLGGKPGTTLVLSVFGLYDPADMDDDGDGVTEREGDCVDSDPAIFPGAPEVCGDGKDNNCDGSVDEGCYVVYYRDQDKDGFGDAKFPTRTTAPTPPVGFSRNSLDCNDMDPAVNPRASEICSDGRDNNCDGIIDGPNCPKVLYFDGDRDGYGDPRRQMPVALTAATPSGYVTLAGDCNDTNPNINPGAREVCGDRMDNNCNGMIDEGCQ